jgi:uncharacterized protein YbaP (TraB family)
MAIVSLSRRTLLSLAAVAALALLGTTGARAQDGHFDNGVLWRLDPPGGGRPSYLLGTIHISDPRVLDLPVAARLALAASDVAVFELIAEPGAGALPMASAFYGEGRDLETALGPRLWEDVVAVGRGYGMTPTLLRRLEPWVLVLFFSIPVDEMRAVMAGATVLDTMLQDLAREQGKSLIALETADEQIAAFEALSEADQIALLRAIVEDKAEQDEAFHAMVELYLAGDLAGIAAVAEGSATDEEAALLDRFMTRIKVERDARMFERLQPLLPGGGLFIAVGALHLTGESGLLARFARAGWTVTRGD